MKKCLIFIFVLSSFFINTLFCSSAVAQKFSSDSVIIKNIFNEALSKGQSYEMLDHLANNIGGRLSGSEEAAKAVEWSKDLMLQLDFDTVFLQEVMVPHWVRGEKEEAKILVSKDKKSIDVPVAALGGSIATSQSGLSANVIEVHDFEALRKLGSSFVKGKIVFFNRPMDPTHINTFDAYTDAVGQRGTGAVEAAKLGAVGVVVRSINLFFDDYPHTGAMNYEDGVPKIPAVAISTNGAEKLSKLLAQDSDLKFFMKVNSQTFPDALSYNVIGEIRGTEKPEEIVLVGGHLDSWDLGQGAHDDGAGCVQAIEALRLFKALGIKPKGTIRAVLFMNEENGVRGGLKYAELAKKNNENHIAAIESDAGGFTPRGFTIDAEPGKIKAIQKWSDLLAPYGLHDIGPGFGGVDINPLKSEDIALIGLLPDTQRYFHIHHASTDTFDQVNKRELELGAGAMAALLYLLSEYGLK